MRSINPDRQLELAGEMRSATREILKRIYEYEELAGISFLDQKNMLLDFMCDLSDQQYDFGIEIEKRQAQAGYKVEP